MNHAMVNERLWSIVLAGGEGERIRPLIQRWLGRHKPKQYCAFVGTRSMFQHTLDRAGRLVAPERTVAVVARAHQREAWSQLGKRAPGTVILQPANRDTAAGIFLSLTHVRARDPEATVVIYPSDHFVHPEDRFVEAVRRAVWAAEWLADRLVLLGIVPDNLELDYGWIQPEQTLAWSAGHRVRTVRTFLEKPGQAEAAKAMAAGALWNTMVMAARVETLWKLGWRCFPEMMPLFERLGKAIGTAQEGIVLDSVYRMMPARNFSSDLLQCAADQVGVIELSGVLWSDWGKPERIADTLRRIGKQPAFPLEHLAAGRDAHSGNCVLDVSGGGGRGLQAVSPVTP